MHNGRTWAVQMYWDLFSPFICFISSVLFWFVKLSETYPTWTWCTHEKDRPRRNSILLRQLSNELLWKAVHEHQSKQKNAFLKFEVEADDPLIIQLCLCLAIVFGFSPLFTAVYNKNYSVQQQFQKLLKYTNIQNLLNLWENNELQECHS